MLFSNFAYLTPFKSANKKSVRVNTRALSLTEALACPSRKKEQREASRRMKLIDDNRPAIIKENHTSKTSTLLILDLGRNLRDFCYQEEAA